MNKIKVFVIDDSSVIRNIVTEILNQDELIEVVGEAKDPFEAREKIKQLNPDVLTLDVEMPKMDGITFLSNLMRLRPMPVVMLSTLTTHGADITLEALELGAVDFIAKPSFEDLLSTKDSFESVLLEKVKSAVAIDQKNYALAKASLKREGHTAIRFTGSKRANHLVAIGASTGGTEAIKQVLISMPSNAPGIVITQHIPKTFSERFANRLNACCEIQVQEAKHGQKIKSGNAYISPGDMHLTVAHKGGGLFCVLDDSPPVNRHKPSVDVLFYSLQEVADNVQAVLLTGMGQDGAKGMLCLKELGARTVIQDRQSSLIWGMPGSAHRLNAQCEEFDLTNIAGQLLKYAGLERTKMREVYLNGQ
ncbi:protein-glutamate methylesterase/protein-glutamine glutaminase [Thalassotalea hakodatensis]|uniref:protein-glutamate methylesterase/protein-glutamine glutaminase n=1 Tax=Thalassotalea hakodatensis TaxID=3030492 RepID=UPI0025739ABB|nr:chemotaxis response regulator protein-glutamate methylesterase [Thalassotalea hakodatensis]